MKKTVYMLSVILVFTSLVACSSLDSDAKKAADLNKESIEYIREGDLENAEKAFKEAKEIITQYRETKEYEHFYEAYNKYLFAESSKD